MSRLEQGLAAVDFVQVWRCCLADVFSHRPEQVLPGEARTHLDLQRFTPAFQNAQQSDTASRGLRRLDSRAPSLHGRLETQTPNYATAASMFTHLSDMPGQRHWLSEQTGRADCNAGAPCHAGVWS